MPKNAVTGKNGSMFFIQRLTRQRLRAGKLGVFNKEISEEAGSKSTPNRDCRKQEVIWMPFELKSDL